MRPLADAEGSLDAVVGLLAAGSVVAIPTDTVYGLASSLDAASIRRLFAVKGRPATLPIAVLCATTADAVALASAWPPSAAWLAGRSGPARSPGRPRGPRAVARLGSERGVGVRVPHDALCRALLARTGPLAVTSANRHGQAPATTAEEVRAIDGVAAVLDGGTRSGAVPTVVDLTGPSLVVVRDGAVPAGDVLGLLSEG